MKSNAILTIFKKELFRFFKDRRTMMAIIMPGILIYVIYTFMGSAMSESFMPDDEHIPIIYSQNTPDSFSALCQLSEIPLTPSEDIEAEKELVKNDEADLVIVFPENFDELVAAYSTMSGLPAPNVEIYYNSAGTNSSMTFSTVSSLLGAYESSITNKFDINNVPDKSFDLASEEDLTSMIFSMMMPMLLITLLFSGCMAVAPESIAGEKERGTIAALLVTPAKRSHIALGKILALSVVALISGTSSTLGVVLALPKLMGDTVSLDGSVYTPLDYAMLAVVILSTVLVLITAISIISAFAKTIKEASSYISPLMIVSMLVGLSGMFGATATSPVLYIIPIFNSVQCMVGIFSFEFDIVNMVVTVISNIVFTGVGVFLLAKMFNSEKIMFNK